MKFEVKRETETHTYQIPDELCAGFVRLLAIAEAKGLYHIFASAHSKYLV